MEVGWETIDSFRGSVGKERIAGRLTVRDGDVGSTDLRGS